MRIALIIFATVFLVYLPTLENPFFFDDGHYVVNNAWIQSPKNLLKLWTSASYYSNSPENWGYRPFTTFTHSLAWLAAKGAPWPFHIQKIILHSIVCIFLVLIWSRLWKTPGFFPVPAPELRFGSDANAKKWVITPDSAALMLGLVFAVHTANTQVMNYISATTTLLSGCCYIIGYYLYLRFRESVKLKFLVSSFAFFALSVLAKEEGISFLGVILLTELFIPNQNPALTQKKKGFIIFGYFVLALGLALLLRLMFAESSNIARGDVTRWNYFMTQWRGYLRYMQLLIVPVGLNADNLAFGFATTFLDLKVILALIGNLGLFAWAVIVRNKYPIVLFSLLWFYIAVSPASSVIPLAEPVNDHRMYHAYFGFVGLILPWTLKWIGDLFRGFSLPVALSVALALVVATEYRNSVWRSQESLWGDTVEKNPDSGRALNNLALAHMSKAEWEKALDLLLRCEKVAPTYAICRVNVAIVLGSIGRDREAERKFEESIAMDPIRPELKILYGNYLHRRGRYDEAVKYYLEADQITQGGNIDLKISIARAFQAVGRIAEALAVVHEMRARFGERAAVTEILKELSPP